MTSKKCFQETKNVIRKKNGIELEWDCFSTEVVEPCRVIDIACDIKENPCQIPDTYESDVKEIFSRKKKSYNFLPFHQKSCILPRKY